MPETRATKTRSLTRVHTMSFFVFRGRWRWPHWYKFPDCGDGWNRYLAGIGPIHFSFSIDDGV